MRSCLVLALAVAQGNERNYTGTCNTGERTVQLAGKVDGKKVTRTYKSEYNGSPLTVVFKGAIESPTKMAGTVLAEEFNVEGDFTATK